MARYVFDIETNGLLNESGKKKEATKVWLIVMKDIDTEEEFVFGPEDRPITLGVKKLESADLLIGHNILMYDFQILKKFYPGFAYCKAVDTMIMSQSINVDRKGGHSLAAYGKTVGIEKPEHEDWDNYSPEMRHRCVQDVRLNLRVYNYLVEQFNKFPDKRKKAFRKCMIVEQAGAEFVGDACRRGWPFDAKLADELLGEYQAEMQQIENEVQPKMGYEYKLKDTREAGLKKDGTYDMFTCKWFSLEPEDSKIKYPKVKGDYCRVENKKLLVSSPDDQKKFAARLGWVPDEWNYKFIGPRKRIKTSPKITDKSLKKIGDIGEKIARYNSLSTSFSVIKTWRYTNYKDGVIHPDMFYIGTNSFRCRHSIIANVKKPAVKLGQDMRKLFTSGGDDYVLVGADSKSNQIRGLAHLLQSEEFTDQVLNQDIHTYNMHTLDKIVNHKIWDAYNIDEKRDKAKTLIYATIYGAGFRKVAMDLIGDENLELGKRIKTGFLESIPGFAKLDERISEEIKKKGFIVGIDGRKIPAKSPHMGLCYLLQAIEKISMSSTIYIAGKLLEEKGVWYRPVMLYHDELEMIVKKKDVNIARECILRGFKEGAEMFGIKIFEGDFKTGDTWLDVH